VGDSAEVQVTVATGGAPNAVILNSITLPTGVVIDTTKLTTSATDTGVLGIAHVNDAGVASYSGLVVYQSTTTVKPVVQNAAGTTALDASVSNSSPFSFGSGDNVVLSFRVPVVGWSSNSVMSNDTDTRVVSFSGTKGSTQAVTANTTDITFTSAKDSHGAWSGSQYVVPVAGDYQVASTLADSAANSWNAFVYLNGVSSRVLFATVSGNYGGGSAILPNLKAGDTISIRSASSITVAGNAGQHLSINRLSGPATIAATEKVYAQYTGNAGTAITANTTNLDFSTKVADSHGAFSGTVFTAPRPGWYEMDGAFLFTAGSTPILYAYVNTVQKLLVGYSAASTTRVPFHGGIYLNGGDQLSIRSDTSLTESNSATQHWISISSQGGI
jgi:hypothetical protein